MTKRKVNKMGNVYLTPKVRDVDIPVATIDDNCLVLCVTHEEPRIEIDTEMFYGRVKKVQASVLKASYTPPNV